MALFVERMRHGGARARRGGRAAALHRPPRPRRASACASRSSGPRSSPRTTPSRTLFVAFDYGGRAEILRRRRGATRGGGEEEFRTHLYAPDLEDPQLIIRTGGELRLSNFLLWESAYSELYFSDKMWPDFDREEFERALCRPTAPASTGSGAGSAAGSRAAAAPAGTAAGARRRAARSSSTARAGRGRAAVGGRRARDRVLRAAGTLFALLVIGLGIVALHELYRLLAPVRPLPLAGFIGLAGLVAAATYGDQFQMVLALSGRGAADGAAGDRAPAAPPRDAGDRGDAARRLLDRAGARARRAAVASSTTATSLLFDVLLATFIGDTGAYFGGRLWGTTQLAPRISPAKTVEGLIAGFVSGTMAFWFAGLYQDWLSGTDALLIGACVAARGPDRRPVRVDDQARPGGQGQRPLLRRARRRAGPPRRRDLHRDRGVLRGQRAALGRPLGARRAERSTDAVPRPSARA